MSPREPAALFGWMPAMGEGDVFWEVCGSGPGGAVTARLVGICIGGGFVRDRRTAETRLQ